MSLSGFEETQDEYVVEGFSDQYGSGYEDDSDGFDAEYVPPKVEKKGKEKMEEDVSESKKPLKRKLILSVEEEYHIPPLSKEGKEIKVEGRERLRRPSQ